MSNKDGMDMNKKDDNITEEVLENNDLVEEFLEEDIVEENNEPEKVIEEIDIKPSFLKRLLASLLDQAILIGVAALLLVVFNFLIGFIGFMVAMPSPMLLIFFGVLNVFYIPVFERKNRRTIGKRILAIG
ncbi:MAG: RDD family protein [Clostridium sp.]|uniref:RDD family protein n=1 Tax=Clostridium sp. TaxID=1506 RepID=UPI002FC5FE6F